MGTWLAIVVLPGTVGAAQDREGTWTKSDDGLLRISDALLPGTRSWMSYNSFPEAGPGDIAAARRIAASERSDPGTGKWDREMLKCSALRLLDDKESRPPLLRVGHVFEGAPKTLMFSGRSFCSEEVQTLFWRDVTDPRTRFKREAVSLLRVKAQEAGRSPLLLGVWSLGGPDGVTTLRTVRLDGGEAKEVDIGPDLELPKGMRPAEGDMVLKGSYDLLGKPRLVRRGTEVETDDPPAEGQTREPDLKPGAKVRQLYTWKDPSGLTWRLVMTSPENYNGMYGMAEHRRAGWIRPLAHAQDP